MEDIKEVKYFIVCDESGDPIEVQRHSKPESPTMCTPFSTVPLAK